MADARASIPAAAQAALWALSNGTCYAPGCNVPVVLEVRPNVYRKNAQIAHNVGVAPGSPRHRSMPDSDLNSFRNLLLLCLAHHGEVDDKQYGEKRYPENTLREWKLKHEDGAANALAALHIPDGNEDVLFNYLTSVFEPPLSRLEKIAKELERTGTLNATSVAELRQTIRLLQDGVGVDARTASTLLTVADVFSHLRLDQTASQLRTVIDVLPAITDRLDKAVRRAQNYM